MTRHRGGTVEGAGDHGRVEAYVDNRSPRQEPRRRRASTHGISRTMQATTLRYWYKVAPYAQ